MAKETAIERQRGGEGFHLGQARRFEAAPDQVARRFRGRLVIAMFHYRN
jgi:hypothetical protein